MESASDYLISFLAHPHWRAIVRAGLSFFSTRISSFPGCSGCLSIFTVCVLVSRADRNRRPPSPPFDPPSSGEAIFPFFSPRRVYLMEPRRFFLPHFSFPDLVYVFGITLSLRRVSHLALTRIFPLSSLTPPVVQLSSQ